MKLLPPYCATFDYDSFKLSNSVSSLLDGLDDQDDTNGNVVYAVAHGMCQEVLERDENLEDKWFSIVEFLQLISSRCKGFSYEKIPRCRHGRLKLLGLIYTTATMRQNY